MHIGHFIREVRLARGWTQVQLAEALTNESGQRIEREYISRRWESGKHSPSAYWLRHLATVLGIPMVAIDNDVNRRQFLSTLTASAAAATGHYADIGSRSSVVAEMSASLAGGDAGPLRYVQTSHAVDHAIAAGLDTPTFRRLTRWSETESSPIARVNALGILAKHPEQAGAGRVAVILAEDLEVQRLYLRAVVARLLDTDTSTAAQYLKSPDRVPDIASATTRLIAEVVSPGDAGARWCAGTMLANLAPYTGRLP
ncbi:helix-turn-helix transcriptional regulator [Nocardia rhizosphaerihabitans]|uniref:helix-turn-helix transcriptional regulator n=1 Tax=Nocardia rhizosphaerihabitans TaxID=1691570 RepID=UPI0036727E68